MSEWTPITTVGEHQRKRFVDFAAASAFATRARLYAYDEIDGEALAAMRQTFIDRFGQENAGCNDDATRQRFYDGLARLPYEAPLLRSEIENRPLDGWLWGAISADETIWVDATSVQMRGQFHVIYSGIEFDAAGAERFGIGGASADQAESGGTVKVRKLRGGWPEWIASAVFLASEGKLHGALTETEVFKAINDDLAGRDIDEIPRSTAQDKVAAILRRLRNEGIYS